jgi:hypothetical protein
VLLLQVILYSRSLLVFWILGGYIYIENGAIVIVWTLAEDIIADSHCNGMVETDKGISSTVNTVANPFKEYKEYDWITGAARRYIII